MADEIFSANNTNSIFISDRHIDKKLANVVREETSDGRSGHANISRSSSAPKISKIGTGLGVAIARAISESNRVFQERNHA